VRPREILSSFDVFLESRGLRLDAVVVGGAALNLLGVITRPTNDCDILYPDLTETIRQAAREFAAVMRERGEILADDWLNNGPASLAGQLPLDWKSRLQPAFSGAAISLHALGREDLLRSKLFALCDRAIDLPDCLALAPTADEIAAILPWLERQDTNPGWPAHARATMQDLARRLGHGV
jgi:hypothetical protein